MRVKFGENALLLDSAALISGKYHVNVASSLAERREKNAKQKPDLYDMCSVDRDIP